MENEALLRGLCKDECNRRIAQKGEMLAMNDMQKLEA